MADDSHRKAERPHRFRANPGLENAVCIPQGLAWDMTPDEATRTEGWRLTPLRAGLLAFLPVLVAGLWAIGAAPAGVYYDDGIYLILGRALAEGEGLRYLNLPGLPAAIHYPPGYPALLALCWRLGGDLPTTLALAKGLNALLLAGAAGLLAALLAQRGARPLVASLGVAAGAIATPLLSVTTVAFSEPMFVFTLILAAWATSAAAEEEATLGGAALAGAAWGVLFLVRSVGIVALPVGMALLLRRHRWPTAAVGAAVALALMTPWIFWSGAHAHEVPGILAGSYGSYTGWYLAGLEREGAGLAGRIVVHNLRELGRPLGVLYAPPVLPAAGRVFALAGAVLLGIGGRRLCRLAPFLGGFLAGYMLIVIAWPYPPDRFVWGIWPLVTATAALGFAEAVTMTRQKGAARLAGQCLTLCAAVSVTGYLAREGSGLVRRSWRSSQAASAQAMGPAIGWVRAHVPDSAVVATVSDPMLYLYTGRRAVPVLSWRAEEHLTPQTVPVAVQNLETILAAYRPAYVILPGGGTPEAFAAEQLWKVERRLMLVDTLPGGGAVFAPSAP
jgi:hypothetical protein